VYAKHDDDDDDDDDDGDNNDNDDDNVQGVNDAPMTAGTTYTIDEVHTLLLHPTHSKMTLSLTF
jgi:hypothetical protein